MYIYMCVLENYWIDFDAVFDIGTVLITEVTWANQKIKYHPKSKMAAIFTKLDITWALQIRFKCKFRYRKPVNNRNGFSEKKKDFAVIQDCSNFKEKKLKYPRKKRHQLQRCRRWCHCPVRRPIVSRGSLTAAHPEPSMGSGQPR